MSFLAKAELVCNLFIPGYQLIGWNLDLLCKEVRKIFAAVAQQEYVIL